MTPSPLPRPSPCAASVSAKRIRRARRGGRALTAAPEIPAVALALPLLAALLAALLAPLRAEAGPWPRAEGTAFLSYAPAFGRAGELDGPFRPFDQIYAEWGMGDGWTLVADAYREDIENRPWSWLLGASRLIARSESGAVLSANIGAGMLAHYTGDRATRLRAGLSAGRGFGTELGNGWMALDASVEHRSVGDGVTQKQDLTLGLKPARDSMLILQLQRARDGDAPATLSLAPSAAFRASDAMTLQLSGSVGVQNKQEAELRMKVWLEF